MEKCTKCEKEFETSEQLRGHMMSHKRGRASDRKKRVGLGTPHRRLSGPKIPGMKTRWINDNWAKDPSRIQRALDAGWEFVDREGKVIGDGSVDGNQDLGSRVSRAVGTNKDGSPIIGYWMAIDKELYDEYQEEKQVEVNKVDAAIMSGSIDNTLGAHGFIPENAINMRVET